MVYEVQATILLGQPDCYSTPVYCSGPWRDRHKAEEAAVYLLDRFNVLQVRIVEREDKV